MPENKIQYKCEKHGIQGGSLMFNVNISDGNIQTFNYCIVCTVEMFTRNGLSPMAPVIQVVETEAKSETWELE